MVQPSATDQDSRHNHKNSSQTTSRDANTTYRNYTSIQCQFKTGVLQGGVLSPTLFNIYTVDLQPPLHKNGCSNEIHTTIPTYRFCKDKSIQSHTKSRQNNLPSVHSRPCGIYEQSGPQNKRYCTTHVNAPKRSGSCLRPKTHIQHTHSHHLTTCTQSSINNKITHCNRMG